jgi:hypothetical protein
MAHNRVNGNLNHYKWSLKMPLLDDNYNILSSKAKSWQVADKQEYRTTAAGS